MKTSIPFRRNHPCATPLITYSQRVPFGVAVVPVYMDPLGVFANGVPQRIAMQDSPLRLPEDLIRSARKNLVVPDGWASAFFHPYLPRRYLEELVQALKALGYVFAPVSDSAPPIITSEPSAAEGVLGGTATLEMTAFGSGQLFYQWQRSGTNLPGANAASLTILNLALADAGLFSVIVSNLHGSVMSDPATLTPRTPPLRIERVVGSGVKLEFTTLVGLA